MRKNILITGASKGIGLETSRRLTSKGYHVIGLARNASDDFPGELLTCDLSDIDQTSKIIEFVRERYKIDAIVNNVGISHPQSLEELSFELLQQVYDLNVRVAVQIAQAFIGGMKERRWGRIVNISSRAIHGVINRTAYSAAKAALIGCTRTWALELASFGITVNAIAPGPIETELFRKSRKPGSEQEKKVLSEIPMRRIGKTREVAAAIEFFLSEDAGFITGQILHVDGGASR